MKKLLIILVSAVVALGIGSGIFFGATPIGREIMNGYHKDIENTDYRKQKEVENTCRAYIVSYKADKAAYYAYRDSTDALEHSWALGYKNRANSTAMTYNEYFLKNSYVWKDNIPDDIEHSLPIIED
jgi:uncharacterized protein YxeA